MMECIVPLFHAMLALGPRFWTSVFLPVLGSSASLRAVATWRPRCALSIDAFCVLLFPASLAATFALAFGILRVL